MAETSTTPALNGTPASAAPAATATVKEPLKPNVPLATEPGSATADGLGKRVDVADLKDGAMPTSFKPGDASTPAVAVFEKTDDLHPEKLKANDPKPKETIELKVTGGDVHKTEPDLATQDKATHVKMLFPKPVTLTVRHGLQVEYKAGVQEVASEYVDHPYLKANGVTLVSGDKIA